MLSQHAVLLRCIEKRYRGAYQARSARRKYALNVAHMQGTLELEAFDLALWEHSCIIALQSEWDPEDALAPCASCGMHIRAVQVCSPDGGRVHWGCAPAAAKNLAMLAPRVARRTSVFASCASDQPQVTNQRCVPLVVEHPAISKSKVRFSSRSTYSRRSWKPHIPSHALREMELSGLVDHGAQSDLSYALDKPANFRCSRCPGTACDGCQHENIILLQTSHR